MSLLSQKIKAEIIAAAPRGQKGKFRKFLREIEGAQARLTRANLTPDQRIILERILGQLVQALLSIIGALAMGKKEEG